MLWNSESISSILKVKVIGKWTSNHITASILDVISGSIFIPVQVDNRDGHVHIKHAFKKGACAVICHRKDIYIPCGVYVPNTSKALFVLAQHARSVFKGRVIAVTGSSGKTSCKDTLYQGLKQKHIVYKSIKSYNGYIGLPICLCNINLKAEYAILEIGIDKPFSMYFLREMCKPHIAVLTDVCRSHNKSFAHYHDILVEKCCIFAHYIEYAVIPGDQWYTNKVKSYLKRRNISFITFGSTLECHQRVCKVNYDSSKMSCSIFVEGIYKKSCILFSVNRGYVRHILIMLIINYILGIKPSLSQITLRPSCQRGDLFINKNKNVLLIDESFNANPGSSVLTLRFLFDMKGNRTSCVCFGGMSELGSMSNSCHFFLGYHMIHHDYIFLYGDVCVPLFVFLKRDSLVRRYQYTVFLFNDFKSLTKQLMSCIKRDSCILVKGSRIFLCENICRDLIKNYDLKKV